MAKICILVAALAVSTLADPLRHKRSNSQILTAATATASGAGGAEDIQAALVSAVGIPSSVAAAVSVDNSGTSELSQGSAILQATNNSPEQLDALNNVQVGQVVEADDTLEVVAQGNAADVASSSDAAAGGEGSILATGDVSITNDGSGWGMPIPQ